MTWPVLTKQKGWGLRGISVGSFSVDAPPADAPAQQWLDFAALCALCDVNFAGTSWPTHAVRAYREKWSANEGST